MKDKQLAFEVWRTVSKSWERYHALRFRIGTYRHEQWFEETFEYTWQAHEKSEPSEWYGFDIVPRDVRNFGRLAEIHSLAKRIEHALQRGDWTFYGPDNILKALNALKFLRLTRDARSGRHLPTEKILPDTYQCWLMDYKACGFTNNEGDLVMAVDKEDAQRQLLHYFMATQPHYSPEHRLRVLLAWETAGRPVELLQRMNSETTERRGLDELLRSPKEAAAVVAA